MFLFLWIVLWVGWVLVDIGWWFAAGLGLLLFVMLGFVRGLFTDCLLFI